MNWLIILKYVLQFALWIARQQRQRSVEMQLLLALDDLHAKHVDDAADARDAVDPGDLPGDKNPNQRD